MDALLTEMRQSLNQLEQAQDDESLLSGDML